MRLYKELAVKKEKNAVLPKVVIGVVLVLNLIMSAAPQLNKICAILMVPCILILFFYDEFYILSAMFLFFTEQLIISEGLPIFKIYLYLLLIKFIIYDIGNLKFKVSLIVACFIFTMYGIFVLPYADVSTTISIYLQKGVVPPSATLIRAKVLFNYIMNFMYVLFLTAKLNNDRKICRKMFVFIVVTALLSGLYGIQSQNIFLSNPENTIVRQMGSLNDPNYASFFFNIAIFTVLSLSNFKNLIIKIPILIVLYYFLIAVGSMTGFILNIMGLIVYAIIRYKGSAIIALLIMIAIGASGGIIISHVPKLYNSQAIQSILNRVENQFIDTDIEDMNRLTSGRADIWHNYYEFFNQQSLTRKLFGGNVLMTNLMDSYFTENLKKAPHQAYISFIINIGLIGTILILLAFLLKFIACGITAIRKNDDIELCIFLMSLSWIVYGMALDYFFDIRFMMFYFI